jgi:hypothetical protein
VLELFDIGQRRHENTTVGRELKMSGAHGLRTPDIKFSFNNTKYHAVFLN